MTDNFSSQEQEIIKRLSNLKNAGPGYPADLLEKQRASYRKASLGLVGAVPAGGIFKGLVHLIPHMTKTTLEWILISTLVAEVGACTYIFRDQIRDILVPRAETPVAAYDSRTPRPTLTNTATPTPTATATRTSTATPKPASTDQGHHYGQTQTPKP